MTARSRFKCYTMATFPIENCLLISTKTCRFTQDFATLQSQPAVMEQAHSQSERQVYSLFDITESITRMFRKHYAMPFWIRAEISKLNLYPHSGHCYPDLVDRQQGKVRAQVRGIIWRDDLFEITRKFESVTRESFREGINIMFLAYVRFSSEYGLSLQITDIEPLFTLGELAREKLLTIERLKKEGLFNQNKLLEMPLLPARLAVISAETSKGYSDLKVTLENNVSGYRFHLTMFHALLQGNGAVESIRRQLLAIQAQKHLFDAVLIIRGGGDETGMSCYDNYALASLVAGFPIPVITGIGHSTNETVAEMVAAINKITPTAVAHYLIGRFDEFSHRIGNAAAMLEVSARLILQTASDRFAKASEDFVDAAFELIKNEQQHTDMLGREIRDNVNATVFNHRIALSRYETGISTGPARILMQSDAKIAEIQRMVQVHKNHFIKQQIDQLNHTEGKVKLLDPVNVLKRGFSITRLNGKALKGNAKPAAGDELETETLSGKIFSTVFNKELS